MPFAPPGWTTILWIRPGHMSNRLVFNSDWADANSRDMFFLSGPPEGLTKKGRLILLAGRNPDEWNYASKNFSTGDAALLAADHLLQDDFINLSGRGLRYDVENVMTSMSNLTSREIKDKIQFHKNGNRYYKGVYISEIVKFGYHDRQRIIDVSGSLMRLAADVNGRKPINGITLLFQAWLKTLSGRCSSAGLADPCCTETGLPVFGNTIAAASPE